MQAIAPQTRKRYQIILVGFVQLDSLKLVWRWKLMFVRFKMTFAIHRHSKYFVVVIWKLNGKYPTEAYDCLAATAFSFTKLQAYSI